MPEESQTTYREVNDRLKEIADRVADESLPLDDALDLFEEAVGLGMKASDLLEQDIAQRDDENSVNEEDHSDGSDEPTSLDEGQTDREGNRIPARREDIDG